MKKNIKYFALIAIGYVFIVLTANLNAQENIDSDKNKTDKLIRDITNKFPGNHLGINVDLLNKKDILSIPSIINNNFNGDKCFFTK